MFEKLRLFLKIATLLPTFISELEQAIPGEGKGEQKLALLRQLLVASLTAAGVAVSLVETMWPAIEGMVADIVTALNATGVFHKNA